MTAFARWSIAATHRLHGLTEGPCTPHTARYDLAGGGTVTVPHELPLGPPATAGRTVMMLPAPPAGSLVEHAALFAEDGTELMEIRCDPPETAGDSGTWQVAVAAPGLEAVNDPEEPQYDYPRTSSGPLCRAEETGYLDSTDVFCPFLPGPDYTCASGCPTNRERICINGLDGE